MITALDCARHESLVKSIRTDGGILMKILIVDDHALFRVGMKFLLQELSEEVDLTEAANCTAAIELASQSEYDLVLLDLKMPGSSGIEALQMFRDVCAATPVVVLSGEDTPTLVRASIECGAMGFIPKTSSHEILIQALKLVLYGGVYLPPTVLGEDNQYSPQSDSLQKLSGLTARQLEVLRELIQGKPNKVIAKNLNMSEHTVKAHLSSVFELLGAHNRTEAVYKAAKLGVPLI